MIKWGWKHGQILESMQPSFKYFKSHILLNQTTHTHNFWSCAVRQIYQFQHPSYIVRPAMCKYQVAATSIPLTFMKSMGLGPDKGSRKPMPRERTADRNGMRGMAWPSLRGYTPPPRSHVGMEIIHVLHVPKWSFLGIYLDSGKLTCRWLEYHPHFLNRKYIDSFNTGPFSNQLCYLDVPGS